MSRVKENPHTFTGCKQPTSQTIRQQGRSRGAPLYEAPAGTPEGGRVPGATDAIRVVRVRYKGGVLKPLEELDLHEGEELTVVIKRKSFYEVARELQAEAVEEVDRILWEVRGRGKRLYG